MSIRECTNHQTGWVSRGCHLRVAVTLRNPGDAWSSRRQVHAVHGCCLPWQCDPSCELLLRLLTLPPVASAYPCPRAPPHRANQAHQPAQTGRVLIVVLFRTRWWKSAIWPRWRGSADFGGERGRRDRQGGQHRGRTGGGSAETEGGSASKTGDCVWARSLILMWRV